MSAILTIFAAVLACLLLTTWLFRFRGFCLPWRSTFPGADSRKLTVKECAAVRDYIATAPVAVTLNARSNTVLRIRCVIARYGTTADHPVKWRYFLGAVEVYLPPFWDHIIDDENSVELILTTTLPLVISLNGHTLSEYRQECAPSPVTFIHGEASEQPELLNIRPQTHEEYALSHADELRGALFTVASFLVAFFCLTLAPVFVPWLAGGAILLLAVGLWVMYAPLSKKVLREVHCLQGIPKRWPLFGERDQRYSSPVSLGIIDLIYPRHWQPWIGHDLARKTDIDIYPDRRVVRQGRFLSLRDEVKNFPPQNWRQSAILAAGSLVVLTMLLFQGVLDMPVNPSFPWITGGKTIAATSVKQLADARVRRGDILRLKGTGRCHIQLPGSGSARAGLPFTPFDCSRIIWSDVRALPPASAIVNKAFVLRLAVNRQLRFPADNQSAARSGWQKSAMVLLSDFGEIVRKTGDLCVAGNACPRLKNALVNLGNSESWATLVKSARAGKLDSVNILLRPSGAEALDNLVSAAIAPFITGETIHAMQALSRPVDGGFIINSEEGRNLVSQAWLPVNPDDYPALSQWTKFQRLAGGLMQVPFSAVGIVTTIFTDAHGARHIELRHIPDNAWRWRDAGAMLLALVMTGSVIYNVFQLCCRYQRNRTRIEKIQHYYENCFNRQRSAGAKKRGD